MIERQSLRLSGPQRWPNRNSRTGAQSRPSQLRNIRTKKENGSQDPSANTTGNISDLLLGAAPGVASDFNKKPKEFLNLLSKQYYHAMQKQLVRKTHKPIATPPAFEDAKSEIDETVLIPIEKRLTTLQITEKNGLEKAEVYTDKHPFLSQRKVLLRIKA